MTSIEIRQIFKNISKRYSKTIEEESIIYQFLNNITYINTNEEIEKILKILKEKRRKNV